MSSGLALVYNTPIVFITILIFFLFWVYFKLFSQNIELILVRNFGDNLKNLYWLRKGKRFLRTLGKISIFAFLLNVLNYSIFFYILYNNFYSSNSSFKWALTISISSIIIICWLFFVNWCLYVTLFIHKQEKTTSVVVDKNNISLFSEIENYRLTNVGKRIIFKKLSNYKINKYTKVLKKDKNNLTIKHSLMLIEFYALMINNNYFNSIGDLQKFVVDKKTNNFLSKKEFLITVNGFFNDSIIVNIKQKKSK